MVHLITTKSGHCFAFAKSEQANNFSAKIREMTFAEVAKLHEEIYGKSTRPKSQGQGGRANGK